MAESGLIAAFLVELRMGLVGLKDTDQSSVEDILAEAEDHLCCAQAHHEATGLDALEAELRALGEFGSPGIVGTAFVKEAKKGVAMPTKFTRRAGLAGLASLPLILGGYVLMEKVPRGNIHGIGIFGVVFGLTGIVITILGLRARHKGALGWWGRSAAALGVLAFPMALPFGWGAGAALMGFVQLALAVFAIGMLRSGILPKAPVLTLGFGVFVTAALYIAADNIPGDSSFLSSEALIVGIPSPTMIAAVWLGALLWREHAPEAPRSTTPFATAST